MKRLSWMLVISGLAAVACDQSVGPVTTGSITLRLNVPPASPALSAAAPAGSTSAESSGAGVVPQPAVQSPAATTLESIRVSVSGGPTPKSQTFQCSATLCEGTVEGLNAGTYTVTVEGLVSSQVAYYGRTPGVGVTAGNNTSASVTFQNFQPLMNDFAVTSTTALTFTVTFGTVANADSYIIEWSKTSDFASPSSSTSNATSTAITVSDVGTYFVRVRAVNPSAPSGGRPSDPKSITVTVDQTTSGDDAGTAPLLSSTWVYNDTLAQLNVFPQSDQDWFKFQACTGDVVTLETFAARLTPPSGLNTFLRLRNAALSEVASNNDATGTTDSRIQQTITTDGVYYAEVTGASSALGHYELSLRVQAGPKNATSKCTTTKQVLVDQPQQDTLIALGDQMQLTATALDTTGSPVAGATFTWASDNPSVLSVDAATGVVTAVANGSATITATESGVLGPMSLTVAQAVANVGVSPGTAIISPGGTQQFGATATDANSNTVPNVTFYWASSDPAIATVDQNGLATAKIGAGGTVTISALGKGQPGSASLTVTAQVADHLAFTVEPTGTTAGDAISPAIQVEIQDAAGNRVTSARNAVTIAIDNNAGSGTLAGTKTVNAIDGVASFTGLWINKAGTGYTLVASTNPLTGDVSAGFDISPGPPAKLGFSAQPSNVEGNVVMNQVQVTILDLYDNVTSSTNSVTVSLQSNPWRTAFTSGSTLSGTLTNAALGGVATFNNLRIDKPAPGYTLAAASGSLVGATSSPFTVNLTVQQVAAATSGSHTCAVSTGGSYCWGYNGNAQLGLPLTTYQDSVPALVRGNLTFVQVTTGGNHSCGLTSSGDAYCWGYNGQGQLGNNSTTFSDVPVLVVGGHQFAEIDAGSSHTCAVTTPNATFSENQRVFCWGYNYYGQLGNGAAVPGAGDQLQPARVDTTLLKTATSISAGYLHTCARATGVSGAAYCWGYDAYGQLGDAGDLGVAPPKSVPTLVLGGHTYTSVSAGNYHSCGVRASDEAVLCWGYGTYGQLGNQTNGVAPYGADSLPQVVTGSGVLNFGSVRAGAYHTCGVTTGGAAYCWGNNGNGELGDGNAGTDTNEPVAVSGGLSFVPVSISAGANHSCARTSTAVYCWGSGYNGELGNGQTGSIQPVPVQIKQ